MRPDILAVATALAVQAALVVVIPLHETFVRTVGRTVVIGVDPVDPYDPIRGYHANFRYRGVDENLNGFDHGAADGSPAWVVLQPAHGDEGLQPVRIVRSPAEAHGATVLRARYVARGDCFGRNAPGCRALRVEPGAWYADEPTVSALGETLRDHQAVAELRVTADGDASLIRLRPSGAKMGPGG